MEAFLSVTSLPAIAGTPPGEMFTGMMCGISRKSERSGFFQEQDRLRRVVMPGLCVFSVWAGNKTAFVGVAVVVLAAPSRCSD